ncbi:MAG: phosphoglycerate mutase family protein [Thermoplasmata archaeon]
MQNILDLINGQSIRSAIVIRHAQRCELTGPQSYWTCGLTARGQEQAHEFGRKVAGNFPGYRIFHSPVKRCEQTALALSQELGGVPISPEKGLGLSYLRVPVNEGFAEADSHDDFIRAWFSGLVPPEIFMPLDEARDVQLGYLRSKLAEAPGNTLDIHVTHDWNINVLREGIFGIRHEDAGWPNFLSGLLFSEDGCGLAAHIQDRGRTISAAIPL